MAAGLAIALGEGDSVVRTQGIGRQVQVTSTLRPLTDGWLAIRGSDSRQVQLLTIEGRTLTVLRPTSDHEALT